MAESPFSALTFIAGPALLTNASTVLLLGTINRYGRAIDRARALAAQLAGAPDRIDGARDSERGRFLLAQLDGAQARILIIVRSLTAFYSAVGFFALGTLSFLVGDVVLTSPAGVRLASDLMFSTTMIGAVCLVYGTGSLAWEGRVSYRVLRHEAEFVRHGRAFRRH